MKKLSLFGLLLAGSGSILGMASVDPTSKSVKLSNAFNKLMEDLYSIAEKIQNPSAKKLAEAFLAKRLAKYSAIIPLSSKLETTMHKIYPLLKQEIGDEQQVSMVIDTLEKEFGPSELQSRILKDMQGNKMLNTFYEILMNADERALENEANKAFNKFSQQGVGTLYTPKHPYVSKDVETVPIQDIFKK